MSEIKNEHQIETYKSMIQISIEGFKLLTLINGAAAVALLSYLGNRSNSLENVPDMKCAMLSFCVGVFCTATGLILGYLTQLALFNEGFGRAGIKHQRFLFPAIALLMISALAFGFGAYSAVERF